MQSMQKSNGRSMGVPGPLIRSAQIKQMSGPLSRTEIRQIKDKKFEKRMLLMSITFLFVFWIPLIAFLIWKFA